MTDATPPNPEEAEMKIDPSRAAALVSQITAVRGRIAAVAGGRDVSSFCPFFIFLFFFFSPSRW